jgi:hypothetical protein
MPFVPAVDTVRTAIDFLSSGGETATNVQYFRDLLGTPTAGRINALHSAISDWLSGSWANVASNQWQSDLITSRVMNTEDDIVVTSVITINGVLAAPALPAQNTIAVSTRTGLTGRSRRGRLFHVGLDETSVVNSTIQGTASANIVSAYNALVSAVAGDDWQWVVASFVGNGAPRVTALLTPITNVILTDVIIDSMDTRKPRSI